jgi:chemotaxis protein methyltransferase CheR
MKNGSFDYLRGFLLTRAGLAIDHDKCDLLENRLAPLARKFDAPDVDALISRLQVQAEGDLARAVLEAMVTNETLFFRDRLPFEQLRDLLPRLMKQREAHRHIRIWCAACSTGQEPYSIAMILDEAGRSLAGWRVDIIATDISEAALTTAKNGIYNQFEVQRGLPVAHLLRYFRREGERWRIAEHLQTRIRFLPFNLMSDFSHFGWFDVVFCRNVLIYFDVAARSGVLERISRLMPTDGVLVLGSAETVIGVSDSFQRHPDYPMLWARRVDVRAKPPLRLVAGA